MGTFARSTRLTCTLALLGTLIGGVACSEDTGDDTSDDGSGGGGGMEVPEGMAMVRVIHASADAPAVDVYAAGINDALISGLSFGDTSSYLVITPGTYDFELRAAPSTSSSDVVYSTGPIDIAEGTKITTIAAGLIGSEADSDKFRVLAFNESFGPSGSDNAIVRIVHAGADAPSVDIDLHNDDPLSPEVTGLDRFTASDPAGVPLSAGEALQIGIDANGSRVTAFTTPALPAGAQLFVIATGLTSKAAHDADGFALLAVGPDGTVGFIKQNPVVYALHGSPNAPAVDAFVGDVEVIDNVTFGELTAPLQLPPGEYDLAFYPATGGSERPDGAPAAEASTGTLAAGERYLTIAAGLLGGSPNGFQLDSYAEGFDMSDPDEPRVRVVHNAPDAPAVDVGILNVEMKVNPVLVAGITFPESSPPAGLAPGLGTIPIGVTPAGQSATVVASFHVTTAPGLKAFAIAAGALQPANGASFRLLVVDTATTPWTVATIHPQP